MSYAIEFFFTAADNISVSRKLRTGFFNPTFSPSDKHLIAHPPDFFYHSAFGIIRFHNPLSLIFGYGQNRFHTFFQVGTAVRQVQKS